MAVDYCFRNLSQIDLAEKSADEYSKLNEVPLESWRSASSLRILKPPLKWNEARKFLLADSCRVQALDVGGPVLMDWEDALSTLADTAPGSLTCLILRSSEIVAEQREVAAALVKFSLASLRTSRLRYLYLEGLRFSGTASSGIWGVECCRLIAEALGSHACSLYGVSLQFERVQDARHLGAALVQPGCKLRCLGLKVFEVGNSTSMKGWEWVEKLLRNPACKLLDLRLEACGGDFPHLRGLECGLERLNISSLSTSPELPDFCHKLKEIVVSQQFSLPDLIIALERPDCKLEVIEFDVPTEMDESTMQRFSQSLLNKHCKLKCLELHFLGYPRSLTHIANALRSRNCKLISLHLRYGDKKFSKSSAKILVDALECNSKLCTLKANLPSSVQARVSHLLARNQLLKEGGLLEQPQVKPLSAKLFLCGHQRAGKTTIRKQIFYLVHSKIINPRHKVRTEPPTRGMELQTLTFGEKQLVLCDLAGHKEYHAFHHFFVTGSDRDLFLVVCKATHRPDHREFSFKLRYWFRFIASHRTPGKPCPKVIVVLNFFSSNFSRDVMTSIAFESTRTVMEEYADVLDFGQQREKNVFGINAHELRHFSHIIQRLQDLLTELLDSRSLIPRICDDISSIIAPIRTNMFPHRKPKRKRLLLPLWHIVSEYSEKFLKDSTEDIRGGLLGKLSFHAALKELHNAGQIVFFPPHDEQDDEQQIVIVDCEWFCCNLIGILMKPEEIIDDGQNNLLEPGVWLREDITKILLQQNCQPEYVPHVLQYLHRLELCYPVQDNEMDCTLPTSKLIFPSLLPEMGTLQWQGCEDKAACFGRRLTCEDKVKTLLPAGAFGRLQVKLHGEFGNNSWKVGCGWISFGENCVVAIVRFGGETSRWEDRQWIDIMVCYPEPREQYEITAEKVIHFVKKEIFTICQGIDRGFPAVSLQECVMSEGFVRALGSVTKDVLPLDTIKEAVHKNGIGYNVTWSDNRSTPILNFFLPGELRELVTQDFNALREVAQEFHIADGDHADMHESCETLTDANLSEDFRQLLRILHARFDRQDKMLEDISEGVSHIRNKMDLLLQKIQQEESNIFTSCSYQLVKDLLTGPLPAFPFLTDVNGLWQPLKNLVGRDVELHFMCEWPAGAHEVEGQTGVHVKISTPEWLARAVPVLVPALKVTCCAARLAASVLLPGSHVFIPSFESLSAFGLTGEQLQHKVLPEILKIFVDEVPGLLELTSHQPSVDKTRLRDSLFDLMKGKNVDMERDFQLLRVEIPQKKRIAWVCRDHSKGLVRLKNQDPFQ